MGTGLRVFILSENEIKQISYAKLNRLEKAYVNESLPEYAGKRIKLAVVLVRTEERKPVEIINIDCGLVSVDMDGKFNQNEARERMADAMKMIEFPDELMPSNVIDASFSFAKKTFRNKYTWTPTNKELKKINQLIFKKSNYR